MTNAPGEIERIAEETRFVAAVISRIALFGPATLPGQGRLAALLRSLDAGSTMPQVGVRRNAGRFVGYSEFAARSA